jgi:hypothetical protein
VFRHTPNTCGAGATFQVSIHWRGDPSQVGNDRIQPASQHQDPALVPAHEFDGCNDPVTSASKWNANRSFVDGLVRPPNMTTASAAGTDEIVRPTRTFQRSEQ